VNTDRHFIACKGGRRRGEQTVEREGTGQQQDGLGE